MTSEEFNKKYSDFLEKDHYGLAINDPEFTKWLDKKFEEWTKRPNFNYSQIKAKFGTGRFYAEGVTLEEIYEVERCITNLCKK